MNKFQTLVEELRTDLIIFVDDDFTLPTDCEEALSFITLIITSESTNRDLLMNKLENIDEDLFKLIDVYKQNLSKIELLPKDNEYIIAGLVLELLKDDRFEGLRNDANTICKKIDEHFAQNESLLATTLLNFGLVKSLGALSCYEPFFTTIAALRGRKIARVYNNLEGNKFTKFCEDIQEILKLLPNKNFLLIVDKKLANNQDGNTVISELRDRIGDSYTFFSVLFTSQKSDDPVVPTSHFHFEIQKPQDNKESLKKVSVGLALCAFAVLFSELSKLNIAAIEEAKSTVLESGKENILYLVGMAQAEGEHVFNTINNWFSLLAEKTAQDKLFNQTEQVSNYSFIEGLVSLVNLNFLSSEIDAGDSGFKKTMQNLSSFELFDYRINTTYFPPTPGDIYLINEELYILAGQDCDLVVRVNDSKICRKDGLAELVKCDAASQLSNAKISEDKTAIFFNYFLFKGMFNSLKINLNEKIFFDFKLLDLCSLNEDGLAKYPVNEQLPNTIHKSLNSMWIKYYPALLKEMQEKVKIQNLLKEAKISTECLSLDSSFLLQATNDAGSVSFQTQRIARLKGKFKEYFLRHYWEYKTRMGLNNISVSNLERTTVDEINYGYPNALDQKVTGVKGWLQLSHNRDINSNTGGLPLMLDKKDILAALSEEFRERFEMFSTEKIILKESKLRDKQSKIVIEKSYNENKWQINIVFPYLNQVTNSYFQVKPNMSLKDIFPSEFIDDLNIDPNETCSVNDAVFRLFNEGVPHKFSTEDLETGIIIPSIKFGFRLDRNLGTIIEFNPEEKINEPQKPENS